MADNHVMVDLTEYVTKARQAGASDEQAIKAYYNEELPKIASTMGMSIERAKEKFFAKYPKVKPMLETASTPKREATTDWLNYGSPNPEKMRSGVEQMQAGLLRMGKGATGLVDLAAAPIEALTGRDIYTPSEGLENMVPQSVKDYEATGNRWANYAKNINEIAGGTIPLALSGTYTGPGTVTNTAFTKPWLETPFKTFATETGGAVGAGVAQTEFPDSSIAPVVGGVMGVAVPSAATKTAKTLSTATEMGIGKLFKLMGSSEIDDARIYARQREKAAELLYKTTTYDDVGKEIVGIDNKGNPVYAPEKNPLKTNIAAKGQAELDAAGIPRETATTSQLVNTPGARALTGAMGRDAGLEALANIETAQKDARSRAIKVAFNRLKEVYTKYGITRSDEAIGQEFRWLYSGEQKARQAVVDSAYKAAREAGRGVKVDVNEIERAITGVMDNLDSQLIKDSKVKALKAIDNSIAELKQDIPVSRPKASSSFVGEGYMGEKPSAATAGTVAPADSSLDDIATALVGIEGDAPTLATVEDVILFDKRLGQNIADLEKRIEQPGVRETLRLAKKAKTALREFQRKIITDGKVGAEAFGLYEKSRQLMKDFASAADGGLGFRTDIGEEITKRGWNTPFDTATNELMGKIVKVGEAGATGVDLYLKGFRDNPPKRAQAIGNIKDYIISKIPQNETQGTIAGWKSKFEPVIRVLEKYGDTSLQEMANKAAKEVEPKPYPAVRTSLAMKAAEETGIPRGVAKTAYWGFGITAPAIMAGEAAMETVLNMVRKGDNPATVKMVRDALLDPQKANDLYELYLKMKPQDQARTKAWFFNSLLRGSPAASAGLTGLYNKFTSEGK